MLLHPYRDHASQSRNNESDTWGGHFPATGVLVIYDKEADTNKHNG